MIAGKQHSSPDCCWSDTPGAGIKSFHSKVGRCQRCPTYSAWCTTKSVKSSVCFKPSPTLAKSSRHSEVLATEAKNQGFAPRTATDRRAQGGNAPTISWSASSSADSMQGITKIVSLIDTVSYKNWPGRLVLIYVRLVGGFPGIVWRLQRAPLFAFHSSPSGNRSHSQLRTVRCDPARCYFRLGSSECPKEDRRKPRRLLDFTDS